MTTSTFVEAVRAALGNAPEYVEPGRLHRFPTNGRRGDTSGWAKLFPDGRAGVYGCFRSGASHTWTADTAPMTPAQRAELLQRVAQAAAEREAAQRESRGAHAARIERLTSFSSFERVRVSPFFEPTRSWLGVIVAVPSAFSVARRPSASSTSMMRVMARDSSALRAPTRRIVLENCIWREARIDSPASRAPT